MLLEIFKFFKNDPSKIDFFQLFLEFVSEEDYLSPEEREQLLGHYLSPKQKEGVMNTYQALRQEGRQEGRQDKARLVVLRGKWKGATADYLADLSELPYTEVVNMLKDYNKVYQLWANKKAAGTIAYLTDEEVRYLMDLFTKTTK
jgi:hypothetical protein